MTKFNFFFPFEYNIRDHIDFILNICMATPIILFLYFIINYIFENDKLSGYFLFVLFLSFYIIGFLKNICEYIMTDKSYPYLGSGMRPPGAKNTGNFVDCNNNTSDTYGMPSGHSLLIMMTTIFWSLYFNKKKQYHKSILLMIIASIIMYSRILLGCHTVQQVIIGGIFGCIIGIIADKYAKKKYLYFHSF